MTKRLKISILSLIAVLCFTMAFFMPVTSAKAESVTLENAGDYFELQEVSYSETDKFVYTATVSFDNGVAAGLVFGAEQDDHYWVFNIDRQVNRVKLLYFGKNDEGNIVPTELLTDYFIGNDKMTDSERDIVGSKVAVLGKIQLKVVITPEDDGVHAEFYADNIRRFGVDNEIELNSLDLLPDGVTYKGGNIGFNCFNSKVHFNEIYYGISDYSYYTELYRNQYHFSQYAHWNNDPNGLVYYKGYYHLYYQHNPYDVQWGAMYWGHARSKDLIHWEHLPICLFPDSDWRPSEGYMWSGSAFEYKKGMSDAIDNLNWYPKGEGSGLIAFYTRDGEWQDQMIMSSDDGGITWVKRKLIEQTIATGQDGIWHRVSCRDPKVFPVKTDEYGKTTLWGMVVTGQESNRVWFMKSENLLDWSAAGGFDAKVPECPDIATIKADDGNTFAVLTLTAREYIVGKISYDEVNGKIIFTDHKGGEIDSTDFQVMDFGPDSYATQSFAISDNTSEYYGKTVSLSWYAGVPANTDSGVYAQARKIWNGSGMTIPVIWGLAKEGEGYILTQTPITTTTTALEKTDIINKTNVTIDENSENILKEINTQVFEMALSVSNPNNADISIKIKVGEGEYTEIGWNSEDGYFVDRRNTSSAGLTIRDYKFKFTSGARSEGNQTFYILSDNGGVEVFCDDFKIPFYVLTLASPYSVKAELSVSDEVTVSELTVKEIGSVWRTWDPVEGETVLYVSDEQVELDVTLAKEKELMAYSTSGSEVVWAIESGDSVVAIENVLGGINIKALTAGSAVITATTGSQVKKIQVNVYSSAPKSDLTFKKDGVVAGNWIANGDDIIGTTNAGDGYILSTDSASDFKASINFKLEAVAAAFIFRAKADMSEYIIFNYDNNEKIVKMWSQNREIGRASAQGVNTESVVLRVEAQGKEIKAYLNGALVISETLSDDDPMSGLFGLNVYSGKATFKSIINIVDKYSYASGSLVVAGDSEQYVTALYNRTLNNTKVDKSFYTSNGRQLTIDARYFELLPVGTYVFKAYGSSSAYEFTVEVTANAETVLNDATVQQGTNAMIYLGNVVVTSISVNGTDLTANDYKIENNVLTLYPSVLTEEYNAVVINGTKSLTVTVTEIDKTPITPDEKPLNIGIIVGPIAGGVALVVAVILIIIIRRKKKVGNNH